MALGSSAVGGGKWPLNWAKLSFHRGTDKRWPSLAFVIDRMTCPSAAAAAGNDVVEFVVD